MGKRYLIDSNAIVEYTGKILLLTGHAKVSSIIDEEFNISFINKIEVLAHSSANDKLKDFIRLANMYEMNDDILEKTIELRKAFKIKILDAIIAATALVYNLTLVTRNVADFKKIPGISLLNLWDVS